MIQHVWAHLGNVSGRGQDSGNSLASERRQENRMQRQRCCVSGARQRQAARKKNRKQKLKLQGKVKIYSLLHSQ